MKFAIWIVIHLLAFSVGVVTAQKGRVKPKPKPPVRSTSAPTPPTPSGEDPSKCSGVNGLTPAEIAELLSDHNAARSEQNLSPLTWDCKLAVLAQDWANKSIYNHREDSAYGENIFVSGSSSEPISSVVSRWMLEKPNWNNQTATCAEGKVCVHYVQVMWRTTKLIGCGINRGSTGRWKSVTVCNYDPPSRASGLAW